MAKKKKRKSSLKTGNGSIVMLKMLKYLKNEKLNEILGVVFFALGILILFSVLSFSPSDPPLSSTSQVQNYCGKLGAYLSAGLFLLIGRSVYLLPILIILFGFYEFKEKEIKEKTILKVIGIILIMLGISIFLNILGDMNIYTYEELNTPNVIEKGGVIGFYFTYILFPLIRYGIYIIIFLLIMLGIVLSTSVSFSDFLKKTYNYLVKIINYIINIIKLITKKIMFEFKELFLYIKEKSFKDAIKIYSDDEYEKSSKDIPEPKINYNNVNNNTASDSKEKISDDYENKSPKEEKRFFIFKRKKKEEFPAIDPKINKTYIKEDINQPTAAPASTPDENLAPEQSIDTNTNNEISRNNQEKLKAEQEKLDKEFAEKIIEPEEEKIIEKPPYILPPMDLLNFGKADAPGPSDEVLKKVSDKINQTLESFKVEATVTEINPGPTVTMFEVVPSPGVPVRKIVKHADDLKLRLAVKSIRIIAPIPGKSAVGIEVPNDIANLVTLRDVLDKNKVNPNDISSKLSFGLGKDVLGKPLSVNLTKMPHLLIAGATGAGKSVCINTIIVSMLMYASPDELKFIMIDPKVVELSSYNKLPHLITPVVVDPKKAAKALQWAVDEMEERYVRCGEIGARNIERYNQIIKQQIDSGDYDSLPADEQPDIMPYVVIIVDELADLMMTARDCEAAIARIAQKARAVGIHLILATQRPSVNVITGLIKANFPTRIAFQVSSHVDSKTILDSVGAENLLGNGDMLYLSRTAPKPIRLQGTFLSDNEINKVIEFISNQEVVNYYVQKKPEEIFQFDENEENNSDADLNDPLIKEAEELVVGEQRGSIAMLQKKLKIGHTRAQGLMEALEVKGIVGPGEGPKPREVLVSKEAYFGFPE